MTSTAPHPTPDFRLRNVALVIALSSALPAMAQMASLPGFFYDDQAGAAGVSRGGDFVVGDVEYSDGPGTRKHAFVWSADGGRVILKPSDGFHEASATGVSADGKVIVGTVMHATTYEKQAVWWNNAGAVQALALGNNMKNSQANAVDASGDMVVGSVVTDDMHGYVQHAAIWSVSRDNITLLDPLNGGGTAYASGVNAAGTVVVGTAQDGNDGNKDRAFRWLASTQQMESLGVIDGGNSSHAVAVNDKGDVVVGTSETANGGRAFRWTEASQTMTSLGSLDGVGKSYASAVDASGNVVVGSSNSADGYRGFRWTEATQMQTIEQWLQDAGVESSNLAHTETATGISADGSVVVGQLSNQKPYVARVSRDHGSGLIDVQEYLGSLSQAASAVALPLRDADPVLHGAHGSPMEWLLEPGKTSVRVAGDIARNDRSGTDSEQTLGEFGVAHAFSPTLQAQIALGTSRSKQNLSLDGYARLRSTYVVPTLIWQATPGLYASFTGYYADGDLRMNRGYLNAGLPDHAYGETSASTTALRARMDWRNLWQWNAVSFTPYTSLTLSRTSTDAYTETSGAFPVQWDKRKDKLDVLRLGLDGSKTLQGDIRLSGRVELAHRIGGDSRNSASGQITGLMGFKVDSTAEQRGEWLRLGLGVDLPLGPGRLATTLNATTQGSAPAYWLAASYRVDF